MSGDFIKNGGSPDGNKRRCPYCGEAVGENKTYCASCGRNVDIKNKAYVPISQKKALIIRIAVGAVLVAAFILVYFFILKK